VYRCYNGFNVWPSTSSQAAKWLLIRRLGNPFFVKGWNSSVSVVFSFRSFIDEVQPLSDKKEFAYDD